MCKTKIYSIVLVAIYALIFIWIYLYWLYPNFGYFGFDYIPISYWNYILILILSILPAMLMPEKVQKVSMIIFWLIYITVYIPSIVTPFLVQLEPLSEVYYLALTLCMGNSIIALMYHIPLIWIKIKRLNEKAFWSIIFSLASLLFLYVLFIYRGNLRLVSFAEAYDVRFDGAEVAVGNLSGYAVMMLSGCFFPLFMAAGLVYKKKFFLLFGIIGQVVLYSTAAMKGILLSIPVIIILYFLTIKTVKGLNNKILIGIIGVCLLIMGLAAMENSSVEMLGSIVFMRTLGVPGLLTAQYHNFFMTHPVTYLSHVNGINLIIQYPYDRALGLVIGKYYYGAEMINSNANFWMTDGMAGFGVFGIIISSIILAILFYFIDMLSSKINIRFATLWIVFIAMNLGNTSIFTTLLSGGLGIIIFIMAIMPTNFKNAEKWI